MGRSNALRVLLVGAVSGTPGVGGVAHVQRRTATALTRLGVDVVQVFRSGQIYDFVRTEADGSTTIMEQVHGVHAAASTFDSLDPDVLHATFAMAPLASMAAAWAHHRKVPIVAHPEGALDPRFLAHHRFRKYPYLATLERPLRSAAAVVSVTEGDLADNSRWFGRRAQHFIIPNIVDPPSFAGGVEGRQTGRQVPTEAIYFGRLNDYHKGITRLIALARRTPDIHYTLVGAVDSSDAVAVAALADLPPNVEFLGPLQGDDLYRRVAASDFFIHPARFEAFGNTIPEALGVRCPVIVSRETYLAQTLRTREFGHVLDFRDVAVAESDLRALLAQPDELRRRTERGAAWVQTELSSEAVGTTLIDVYDQIVRRPTPAR